MKLLEEFWKDQELMRIVVHITLTVLGLVITLKGFIQLQEYAVIAGVILTIRGLIDSYFSSVYYLNRLAEEKKLGGDTV